MRKIIFVIFSFFLITINSVSLATSGDGPLKFSTNSFNNFLAYMRGDGNPSGEVGKKKGTPLAFAINETGTYTFYYYCPIKFGDNCYPGHMEAMNKCTINSKKRGGGRCYVFAKKRNIVWDNKVIKLKRKFSEETIRRIFQENNWYGTSSSQSTDTKKNKFTATAKHKTDKNIFINRSANNEDEAKKLALDACKLVVSSWSSKSEEKDNCYISSVNGKEIKKKITKKSNTVEEMKEIKEMLDKGLITEAEFEKLKKEILN